MVESSENPALQFDVKIAEWSVEESSSKKEFLNQVNRGGLVTPTEVAYIACMHIYSFFEIIMKTEEAKKILTQAVNPRKVFVRAIEQMMKMCSNTEALLNISCDNGHEFLPIFKKISASLFNLMMKNFVADMNSSIKSKPSKRSASKSPAARKISKLQSKKLH